MSQTFEEKLKEEILPKLGGDSTDCAQYRMWFTLVAKKKEVPFFEYILWSQSKWMEYARFLGHAQTWEICSKDRDNFLEWLHGNLVEGA